MHFLKSIGLLWVVSICFAACAPRPVFRLESMAEYSTWYQGTEYIISSEDSVTVTVAYIRHLGDKVVFDVKVANYSDETVRVDPADFYFKGLHSIEPLSYAARGYAINPKEKLLQIDMEIAEEEADQKTTLLLSAIGATAMVASDIAEEEDTPEEQIEEAAVMDALVAGTAQELHESEYEIGSLRYRRERWAIETLRKTDLFSGEFIRGKVYFPLAEDARYFNVEIEVGNTIHLFRFRQLKFKP